jgi:hypothetical protein
MAALKKDTQKERWCDMRQDHQEIFDEMMEEEKKAKKKSPKEPSERKPAADPVLPSFPPRKPKKEVKIAKAYKAGGYVKAADGCVKKGKTKGRMV